MPLWAIIGIAVAEFVGLYLLSRRLTRQTYGVLFLITRSRPVAVTLITILLFPGTVIHELSHLFSAEILGVRTGGISFVPESIDEQDIHAGTVMVAETDPFRRAAIGMAPMATGLVALAFMAWWLISLTGGIPFGQGALVGSDRLPWIVALVLYLIFCISNSMFSSPEDMKGVPPVIIVVSILLGAMLYAVQSYVHIPETTVAFVTDWALLFVQSLGLVLGLNILGVIVTDVLLERISRLTGKRIVWKS